MENNSKGSNIFLGVIGVATLIVAIIGATFAFFGAQIEGGSGNLKVNSTTLSLGYEDDTSGIKTNLIPAEYWIAEYAAMDQFILNQQELNSWKTANPDKYYTVDGTAGGKQKNFECMDDNGNEICGTYTFTIGNPSTTTSQPLFASVRVLTNEFTDLWFKIYDENDQPVVNATKFPTSEGKQPEDLELPLDTLQQTLLASSLGKADGADAFVESTPSTYKLVTGKDTEGKDAWNKRTYKMIIWIEETMTNQTATNAGKSFTGSLYFTTANDKTGVTGVIGAKQKPTGANDNPDGTNYPANPTPQEPSGE